MPIFEYVCKRCKNQFEEIVFGQEETAACPSCGSTKTEKLMSCCRAKTGGAKGAGGGDDAPAATASAPSSRGGCAGCSGGSCSTCG